MKRENIFIFGSSSHAKVIIDIIEKNHLYKITGLIDKKEKSSLYNYPIIGHEKDLKAYATNTKLIKALLPLAIIS